MASFRFERFRLDPADRRLERDGAPIELNARYLDALALLVREAGRLVSKDRFLEEVWRGVPVTDEALTQCIRTLRRQLGDEAGRPRFIETVPKHGYRFIAPVEREEGTDAAAAAGPNPWLRVAALAGAGAAGGALAGLCGGLFYGLVAAAQPLAPGMGAASVLLVLLFVSMAVGLVGGAGVGLGIAIGRSGPWSVAGAAAGGLAVGALVKLVGIDAFDLLLGRSPGDITGPGEGALLGGAVGLGAWLGRRGADRLRLRRGIAAAALAGGGAGLAIALLGGRLLGGSLDLLARSFPESRLRFERIGALFGESGFGPTSQSATATIEGALFGGCVAGAMILAVRLMDRETRRT